MPRSTLLVIDDEPNILTTVRRSLEIEGYEVEVAGNGATGLAKLADNDIDLVLLDVMMPGESGLEVLPKIRAASPETIVVMMSGNATIDTAVTATKAGAYDFIEKPLSGDKLLLTVANALHFARLRDENQRLKGRARDDFAMIGKGAAMRAIFDKVAKTAPTTGRVLITGENGTGKELVARALHDASPRRDCVAPVNAPRSCPNSSDSNSSSGIAEQFTATNGIARRGLASWSARATSSLPVPFSPESSTRAAEGPASPICSTSRRSAGEPPTSGVAHDARSRWFSDSSARAEVALRSTTSRRSSDSGFSRKSYAPRRVACTAVSTFAWPLIITTDVSGACSWISASRSSPLSPGNHTSSSTTS